MPFTTQIRYITEKFELFRQKDNKEECKKLFDGQKELVKAMHGYALGYLRHLRAFNFVSFTSLAELIGTFLNLFLTEDYESLTKLNDLSKNFDIAVRNLT